VTHFVASTGTCGTITGTGAFLKSKNAACKVIGAVPIKGHDIPGVRSLEQLKMTDHFYPDLYDDLVEINNQEAFTWTKRLNREEGLTAGPSSGMNVAAAFKGIPDEPGNVVVVILCDPIWKYTSSVIKHLPELFQVKDPLPEYEPAELRVLDAVVKATKSGGDTLDGPQTAELLAQSDGKVVVVDVRPSDTFAEKLQAKDAINIPLDQISNGEPVDLPDDREAPIVCVCNRGVDSLFALMLLKAKGYKNARHIDGGMFAWDKAGLPINENGPPGLPDAKTDDEEVMRKKYRPRTKDKNRWS